MLDQHKNKFFFGQEPWINYLQIHKNKMGVRIYISGNSGNQKVRQKDENDWKSKWHELMFFCCVRFFVYGLILTHYSWGWQGLQCFACTRGRIGSYWIHLFSGRKPFLAEVNFVIEYFQIHTFALYPHSMEWINVCRNASFHLSLMWDTFSQNLAKTVLVHKGIDTYSESLKRS